MQTTKNHGPRRQSPDAQSPEPGDKQLNGPEQPAMTAEALDHYHAARVELDNFNTEVAERGAKLKEQHDAMRQRVFAFVNANQIHEATVFEVSYVENVPVEGDEKSVRVEERKAYYLVNPRDTEIKRVDFVSNATGEQPA